MKHIDEPESLLIPRARFQWYLQRMFLRGVFVGAGIVGVSWAVFYLITERST